jgi:hypothetical protein
MSTQQEHARERTVWFLTGSQGLYASRCPWSGSRC